MMTVARTRASLLAVALLLIAVMALCANPAHAQASEGLTTGAAEVSTLAEAAPAATVKYATASKSGWKWAANGSTSQVAGSKRVTALRLQLSSKLTGSVQYKVYVKGAGWQAVKANGKAAGQLGSKANRTEAVRVALTGAISTWYDVQYRVKLANGSWQAWKANGALAGKIGSAIRGVQVRLVKKSARSAHGGTGIVGVRYRAKLNNAAWKVWKADNAAMGSTAKSKCLTKLSVSLDRGIYSGNIWYRVRTAKGSWQGWKKNGAAAGSKKNIEAVQIKLTGKLAQEYDVVYRGYVRGIGWQARVRNGATAGTATGRKLQAIRIQLVKKTARDGWVGSGSNWSYYKKGVRQAGTWVSTTESPINALTAKSHAYWIDANGKLAVGRIVNPATARDAGAARVSFATKWGYILRSSKARTSKGVLLADSQGALCTATGWLETSVYDDEEQTYYMKSMGAYSLAQTGVFSVSGKKYYGVPDEGYLAKNTVIHAGSRYYRANEEGVLGPATSRDRLIEQYVEWAIDIANDDSHGYTQDLDGRWGPDYDCSSLVVSAVRAVGLDTGSATWTGNLKSELTSRGFTWRTDMKNIRRGDILLVHSSTRQHTEIYIGGGRTVGAHSAETGGKYGVTGDQTGHEIDVGPYYSIWQGYLRFVG